jgi:hypothetical protein
MVCPEFKPYPHEVVSPFPQARNYGCQLQIMSDIVSFMLLQLH